jgi:hypothetical protein
LLSASEFKNVPAFLEGHLACLQLGDKYLFPAQKGLEFVRSTIVLIPCGGISG